MLISSRSQAFLKEGSYPVNFIYCTVHQIKEFCWIGFVLPESSYFAEYTIFRNVPNCYKSFWSKTVIHVFLKSYKGRSGPSNKKFLYFFFFLGGGDNFGLTRSRSGSGFPIRIRWTDWIRIRSILNNRTQIRTLLCTVLLSRVPYLVTGTSWVGRGDAGDCEVTNSGICNSGKCHFFYRITALTSPQICCRTDLLAKNSLLPTN